MNSARLLVGALLIAASAATHATEMFTPGLPASSLQHTTCRIVNVTNSAQTVTVEAFSFSGTVVAGSYGLTLAAKESGGFSLSGGSAMYCKFTVKGPAAGFRAAIEIFELTETLDFRTITALSAY